MRDVSMRDVSMSDVYSIRIDCSYIRGSLVSHLRCSFYLQLYCVC